MNKQVITDILNTHILNDLSNIVLDYTSRLERTNSVFERILAHINYYFSVSISEDSRIWKEINRFYKNITNAHIRCTHTDVNQGILCAAYFVEENIIEILIKSKKYMIVRTCNVGQYDIAIINHVRDCQNYYKYIPRNSYEFNKFRWRTHCTELVTVTLNIKNVFEYCSELIGYANIVPRSGLALSNLV